MAPSSFPSFGLYVTRKRYVKAMYTFRFRFFAISTGKKGHRRLLVAKVQVPLFDLQAKNVGWRTRCAPRNAGYICRSRRRSAQAVRPKQTRA